MIRLPATDVVAHTVLMALRALPYDFAITALMALALSGLGWRFVRRLVRGLDPVLQATTGGLFGLAVLAFFLNVLSYTVTPPQSLDVVVAVVLVAGVVSVWCEWRSVVRTISNKDFKVASTVGLALAAFLYMATFNLFNFDETLHRPVVATILNGNFPINNPVDPFWSLQYSYHYGWELVAASVVAFWRVSVGTGLDIVKYIGFVLGFGFVWGALSEYGVKRSHKIWAILAFFLTGPFWFFHDSYTEQYIFNSPQELVGFSLFHNMQAISFISEFIFLAAVLLVYKYLRSFTETAYSWLTDGVTIAILCAGAALLGEYQLGMAMITAVLTVTGYSVLRRIKRRVSIRDLVRLSTVAIGVTVVVLIQGGLITGLAHIHPVNDLSYLTTRQQVIVAQHNAKTSTRTVIHSGVPVPLPSVKPAFGFRSLKNIGFAPSDNVYIPLTDLRVVVPAVGLLGLVAVPIFAICGIWLFVRRARCGKSIDYVDFLVVGAIVFLVLPLVSVTRFGDQNFGRGELVSTSIVYTLFTIFVLRLRAGLPGLAFKTLFLSILVLSWLPVLAFSGGLFLFRPNLDPSVNTITDDQRSQMVEAATPSNRETFFLKVKDLHLKGNVLTTQDESIAFTEETGMITYHDFFAGSKKVYYNQAITDLDPAVLNTLKADYVFIDQKTLNNLTPAGHKNLARGYRLVIETKENGTWLALYRRTVNN